MGLYVNILYQERCLDPDEKPCELVSEWGSAADKKKDGSEPKILFKKKIFLRDDDREMKDTVAKHYIYIQALYSVIESEYPALNRAFIISSLFKLILSCVYRHSVISSMSYILSHHNRLNLNNMRLIPFHNLPTTSCDWILCIIRESKVILIMFY